MYVGVTNNLESRIADHCDGRGGAFTRKYQLNTLVHVEEFQFVDEAIRKVPRCARHDSCSVINAPCHPERSEGP
jgi:putative endonuclease